MNEKPDLFKSTEQEKKKITREYNRKFLVFIVVILICGFIPFGRSISGIARVVPERYCYIDAFQPGIISGIFADEGSVIKEGDDLLEIKNLELVSELDTSYKKEIILSEETKKLEEEIAWHRKVLDRNLNLYNDEVIAPAEMELTRLKYNNARHELEINKQEFDILLKRREYLLKCVEMTRVKSPMSGIVVGKLKDKSASVVEKGERICQVVDNSKFLLEFPIEEKKIQYAKIGLPAAIRFYAFPEKIYKGELREIRPIFWEKEDRLIVKENVINVLIDFKEEVPKDLRTGMSAFVSINTGKTCFWKTIKDKLIYMLSS
jgi:multidrug resistance efflux pump